MLIRQSRISDARSISSVYVQTWQDTYLGILPFAYLIRMSVPQHEKAFRRELRSRQIISYVAEYKHELIGFVTGGNERHGSPIYTGEVYTLYVMKSHQRQGIGARLLSALAKQFDIRGFHSMLVQVLKENPYRHFYEKMNGVHLKSDTMPFAGQSLEFETYGWIDSTLVYH
jgi:ribosomal protein S18 acetylase RimI-like enzyme